jgi:TfoX/Sxy family transcriptional regulator of competence genes
MAYSEEIADRLREALQDRDDVREQRMFGGLGFMLHGNMAVAASGQGGLMVRCPAEDTDEHVAAGAERMVMRGRPMDGWLRVDDARLDDASLARWVAVGTAYADTLPAK